MLVEFLFHGFFGMLSVHRSHELSAGRIQYLGLHTRKSVCWVFICALGTSSTPGGTDNGHATHSPDDAALHDNVTVHVLVVFLHRVLLFYPSMFGFYRATFNAMRHPHVSASHRPDEWTHRSSMQGTVRLFDFGHGFSAHSMLRIIGVGSVLFVLLFFTSLHWTLVIPHIYLSMLALFVLPLMADHQVGPHVSLSVS